TDLRGDPTVRELLVRVRDVALGAFMHQETPFERLVEELQPERNLSHSPLFQVMFAFNNTPRETLRFAGLETAPFDIETDSAKYDLTFALEEDGGGLQLRVEFNTDLFDESTIERMVGHYERLLTEMVREPSRRIGELEMLSAQEREQILVEWNATTEPLEEA